MANPYARSAPQPTGSFTAFPPAPAPPPAPSPTVLPTHGGAVAAMVLGLVGIILPFLGPFALIFGVISAMTMKGRSGTGMAVTGIVLGALETLAIVVFVLLFV